VELVDGLSVYFGVRPAEMIRGHLKEHPESQMHGGIPEDYRHHITVAEMASAEELLRGGVHIT
jgi:hypothetical protein